MEPWVRKLLNYYKLWDTSEYHYRSNIVYLMYIDSVCNIKIHEQIIVIYANDTCLHFSSNS